MAKFVVPPGIELLLLMINESCPEECPEGGDEFDYLMLDFGEESRREMIDFWSEILSRPLDPGDLNSSWPRYGVGFAFQAEADLRRWLERMLKRLREGVTPGVTLKPLGSRRRP